MTIYLYTGSGAGKTANALGVALRSVGHGHKVVIIQFLKWWKKTGEYKIRKRLKPEYEIHQFGREGWKGLDNLNKEDKKLAQKGLKFAKKIVTEKKPHLIILDEINLAVDCGLLDVEKVVELLNEIPKKTDVFLTGRNAPKELIDKADSVNEIVDVKHPKRTLTKKGIQY